MHNLKSDDLSMNSSFDLKTYLEGRRKLVDEWLEENLPRPVGPHSLVIEAMRYSALSKGKRIRPILLMAAADAVGGDGTRFLPQASALECIHAYSLIHDDLPAMDDDDLRRGVPTCHKAFGEAMAILAGDALLNYAFEILSSPSHSKGLDPETVISVIGTIGHASGINGMVGGQAADVLMEGKEVDEETLRFIHVHKTGAIIKAAIKAGAILGGADPIQLERMEEFGYHLGLLFQIKDDLLDVEGDEKRLGKRTKKDAEKKKATYPALFGIERTKQMGQEILKEAIDALSIFGPEADALRSVANYVVRRSR